MIICWNAATIFFKLLYIWSTYFNYFLSVYSWNKKWEFFSNKFHVTGLILMRRVCVTRLLFQNSLSRILHLYLHCYS